MIIVNTFIFISCKDNKESLSSLIEQWQGREIFFPNDMVFTKYVKDTVDYKIPKSDFKIVLYVDSTGCTSCKLKLYQWKELKEEIDSITDKKVPFIFIFQPKNEQELQLS